MIEHNKLHSNMTTQDGKELITFSIGSPLPAGTTKVEWNKCPQEIPEDQLSFGGQ